MEHTYVPDILVVVCNVVVFRNNHFTKVRASYRQLALLVHPDKNKDPRAGEAFAKLQKVF